MLGHAPRRLGLVDRLDPLRERLGGLGRALVGVHVGDVFGVVAGGEEHRRLGGVDLRRRGVGAAGAVLRRRHDRLALAHADHGGPAPTGGVDSL